VSTASGLPLSSSCMLIHKRIGSQPWRSPRHKHPDSGLCIHPSATGPVAESVLLLENIGTSVLVGSDQLASLHLLLQDAAQTLELPAPDLYVRQDPR
jgi:hypothetical protein